MSERNRVQYIDIAKGIAIICIILGHLGSHLINRVVFTFHVPLFFFITGYFTSTKRNLYAFIKNKARTLIVPYMITCLVIIGIGTLKGATQGDGFSSFKYWSFAAIYGAGDSYTDPFYIPSIGAIWFLWATFWGSTFLRITLQVQQKLRSVIVGLLFAIGYYSKNLFWFPLSIQAGACATLFMYMGYLLRELQGRMEALSIEVKLFGISFATILWLSFIRDFQSFWLVHCDIGRGIVDIFGCICACTMVILISRFIECRMAAVGNILAYFGRYSLLVLCVHIVELNLFPWWWLIKKLDPFGMPHGCQLLFLATAKLIVDLSCVYILSRNMLVNKLFGFKK